VGVGDTVALVALAWTVGVALLALVWAGGVAVTLLGFCDRSPTTAARISTTAATAATARVRLFVLRTTGA